MFAGCGGGSGPEGTSLSTDAKLTTAKTIEGQWAVTWLYAGVPRTAKFTISSVAATNITDSNKVTFSGFKSSIQPIDFVPSQTAFPAGTVLTDLGGSWNTSAPSFEIASGGGPLFVFKVDGDKISSGSCYYSAGDFPASICHQLAGSKTPTQ